MKLSLVLSMFAGIASAVLANAEAPQSGPQLVLLDGRTIPVAQLAIADGKLTGDGVPDMLEIDDLRQIVAAPIVPSSKGKPEIQLQLAGGGLVHAESLIVENDACMVTAGGIENLRIPLEKVRAIRFDLSQKSEAIEKAVAAPSAEFDRVFVKVDEQIESVTGITVALSPDELKLQVEGAERSLPRSRLVALVVAQPTARDEVSPATVTLRDGSTLPGKIESLTNGKLLLAVPPGKVELSWSAVASVAIRSRRVAFLSDLEPTGVAQQSIAFLELPWRRDRSVMGRKLTLGNRTFEKGIGVHATTRLTFDSGGQFDELAAEVGIDAETNGKGDCVFSVVADGTTLYSERVKGSDSPKSIRVDIRGRQEITLVVEAGEGLDLADHGNWCDVRFIKSASIRGAAGASAP